MYDSSLSVRADLFLLVSCWSFLAGLNQIGRHPRILAQAFFVPLKEGPALGFGSVGSTHWFYKVQSGLVFVRSLRQQQLLIISLAGNQEEKSFRASRSLLSLLAFR
ncbi:hypothetical protein VNO80_33804 [Phaseolus coccineus]|uniref:Uncharacterized protein n=1 Tax=Phaseolus coccineus TaxID=3886 RepID=A0AAN9L191_PHACN